MAVVIRHGLVVEFDGRVWAPSGTERVGLAEFAPMDISFKNFVGGVSTRRSGTKQRVADMALVIRRLRNDACVVLGQGADVISADAAVACSGGRCLGWFLRGYRGPKTKAVH